jgi:hypothetical protein
MNSRQQRKEGVEHIDSLFSLSAKLIVACLFILLLIGQSGCAINTPKPYALPPPPSEAVREKLGTVGIVSADFVPKAEICKPMGKGAGAASGAGTGALGTMAAGAWTGDPFGLLLGVALAPVGAIVGSVVGAVKGVSSEHVKKAEDAINKTISELKIQANMRDYVLRAAKQQTEYNFVELYGQGPETPEMKMDYNFLTNRGINTVLEITVPAFGLIGKGINPPFAFFMTLKTRLVRTTDGSVLYEQKLVYIRGHRTFTNWAANNAKPFKDEFHCCYQSLSEKVVEEVFLLYNLPLNPASQPGSRG